MAFYGVCFALLLIIAASVHAQTTIYRLCVNEDRYDAINSCKAINKPGSMVTCVTVKDSANCALKIRKNEADFALFTAEESVLASKFVNDQMQVTHELRELTRTSDPYSFQTVAVVKTGFDTMGNDLKRSLRQKNYCHPGFKDSQYWNDYVLKFFEKEVIGGEYCDQSRTAAAHELQEISDFFKESCRPGSWVHNDYYDNKLKRLYPSICALCDNPGEGCAYFSGTRGDHSAALKCLTHGRGDVTYTALQSVREYFGLISGLIPNAPQDGYKFLCMNGTTQALNTPSPCGWIKQPWNTVVASNAAAPVIREKLASWLVTSGKSSWQEILASIVLNRNQLGLYNVTGSPNLSTYINLGRKIPVNASGCKGALRWCVLPEEKEKCEWMRQAAITHGISPGISCVEASSQFECFKKIQDDSADFIGIDSNLGYITRHTYDLTSQMFQESEINGDYQAVAVISNRRSTPGAINSLEDLRNKKACFPEYGGIAWVSFVEALRTKAVLPNACPYGKTLGQFFSGVCAPGARDPTHDPKGYNVDAKLCSLCRDSCNATATNTFYSDKGAFKCLRDAVGDVAVVNYQALQDTTAGMTDSELSEFSILCIDGKKAPLPRNGTSSEVIDEKCHLRKVVGGELIGLRTRTDVKSYDFYLALLEMDDWFGLHPHNFERVFHMYDEFDGKKNLLFKENTIGLINYYDQQQPIVRDYIDLKQRATKCGASHAASIIPSHATWIITALVATISAATR